MGFSTARLYPFSDMPIYKRIGGSGFPKCHVVDLNGLPWGRFSFPTAAGTVGLGFFMGPLK